MERAEIERIGSGAGLRSPGELGSRKFEWACVLPGVRRLEWHEALVPDGDFVRLPVPGLVVILNVATCGMWRPTSQEAWRAHPAASIRGLTTASTYGRDPGRGTIGYVSLVLAPWAAPMYLGSEAAAFVGTMSDLGLISTVWAQLLEQVALASSPAARCALVERSLRTHAAALDQRLRSLRVLARHLERGVSVAATARLLGVSVRHVHQRSLDAFGVAPSALARLGRFGRGIEALQPGTPEHAVAAWRGEHSDQSHATRSFRRLAGVRPTVYAAIQRLGRRTQFVVPRSTE